jgi:tetratricopeptide (TPR) repeat protein
MKDEYAARIAHHLTSSNQEEKSIEYFLKAANLSRDLHANDDALDSYLKVSKLMKKLSSAGPSLIIEVEEGLGDVNSSIGNSEDALNNFTNYLNLAQQLSSQVDEIKALRKSAEVNRTIGKVDAASEICDEAILKSKAINNKGELINCINTMAFIYAAKGEYDRTIKVSEDALYLTQEINDSRNQSISLSNLGFAYWHIGNYPSAMKYFNEAITIQRSIGDNLGLSTTLNFLGLANWKLGEYESALDNASESVKIKRSIADYRKIPGSLNVIGDIYRSLNDLEKAIEFHSESLALATEHQNKGAMCDNIRDLGEDYMLKRDFESAKNKLDEVLKLSKTSGIMWYETRTYITLSELYLIMGNEPQAELFAIKGLEYANKLNAKDLIIEAMWTQARVLAMNEPSDESARLLKQAIDAAEEVGHKTFLWKLYFDFSLILEKQQRSEEADNALQKSKTILQSIVGNIHNLELKKLFLSSDEVIRVLR